MGKLAYIFMAFFGAIPAGFGLYVMVLHLLDRSEAISGMLLTVSIVITVCLFLVTLSPFIVLVFYRDSQPQLAMAGAEADATDGGDGGSRAPAASSEAFDDAIPQDFDQEELEASQPDQFDDFEEEYDESEYAEDEYDESEFDDFDLDDSE